MSAPAESRPSRPHRDTVSAPAELVSTNRWADLEEEEDEYEGMDPIHFSDAEGVSSSFEDSDCEANAG